jgi:hypothetical protein
MKRQADVQNGGGRDPVMIVVAGICPGRPPPNPIKPPPPGSAVPNWKLIAVKAARMANVVSFAGSGICSPRTRALYVRCVCIGCQPAMRNIFASCKASSVDSGSLAILTIVTDRLTVAGTALRAVIRRSPVPWSIIRQAIACLSRSCSKRAWAVSACAVAIACLAVSASAESRAASFVNCAISNFRVLSSASRCGFAQRPAMYSTASATTTMMNALSATHSQKVAQYSAPTISVASMGTTDDLGLMGGLAALAVLIRRRNRRR